MSLDLRDVFFFFIHNPPQTLETLTKHLESILCTQCDVFIHCDAELGLDARQEGIVQFQLGRGSRFPGEVVVKITSF